MAVCLRGGLSISYNGGVVTVTELWLFVWGCGVLSISYNDVAVTVTEMWLFVWWGGL